MGIKVLSFYFTLLALLAGCMGGGNQELQEATFGMTMSVTPDNQTLEDPATLAQDITVTVRSDDGSASRDSRVTFTLMNPDSGAQLLVETCVTDKTGECSTQVIGGDDFGKVAQIKVQVAGTKLSKVIKVGIRTKIVPTKIQIIDPPSEIVAGQQFQIGLRLIDDNGRVAEDEEFNFDVVAKGIEVTARSLSDDVLNPARFNKTAATDRRITFDKGLAYIQGITHKTAEEITVELYDYQGFVEAMEAATGRSFNIAAAKTFNIVPDVPVKAQLQDMADVTTDDAAKGKIFIYDQYDNHATNFGGVCQMVVSASGDNLDEAYIVDQGDSALRNKTGVSQVVSGVGAFDIRDTNVETATIGLDGINFGCTGITNLGTSKQVDFNVGAVAKIVIRQPAPPNDVAKTTAEIALDIESTDNGGNLTPSFSGLVGLDFDGGCSADINNDDEDVADSRNVRLQSGQKTIRVFNRYLDRKTSETCVMSLRTTADTSEVGDLTSNVTITFVPGDPKQFSFVNALTNGEVGWGTLDAERNRVTIDVEQLDTWGNPVIQGGNTKSVKVVSDGNSEINASGLAKTVSFNSAGKGSIEFYNTKNETVNLFFLDGTPGMRYTNANAENVSVDIQSTLYQAQAYFKWGIPMQAVMLDPTDGDVDAPIDIQVQMQDYGGNIVQDFGTVASPRTDLKLLASSASVNLLDALSFVNGQTTVRASNTVEETVNFSMALNDGVTSFKNSKNIDVNFSASVQDAYYKWGLVGRKFLIEDPADDKVDNEIAVKIQVVDKYGNPVRDYGCAAQTQDAQVNVNGTAKITNASGFDHTIQANFDALTQSAFVDIANSDCPVSNPASETHKDNSIGYVYVFVRQISPYAADFQTINISLDDTAGTGYAPAPASGVNVAFFPGDVAQYRMENAAGTVDDPIEVTVNALDQFNNRVVGYSENDAVTFQWIMEGSTANKAYINPNADGISGNDDDRAVDGDGNVTDFFIDFNLADRGVGKIYLSATYAETYQASLAAKAGYITNNVADIQFKAGVVTQFDIAAQTPVNNITTDAKAHFGIRALDQFSNVNLEYVDTNLQVTANKSMKILTNPTENNPDNYALANPVGVTISAGVGDFYAYDTVAETATLTVSDTLARGYSMIPLEVVWKHGNPVQVAIAKINNDEIEIPTTMSASTKADSPAVIKVQVQDRNGNIATSYNSSVQGDVQLGVQPGAIDTEFRQTAPGADDLPSAGDADEMVVEINSGEGELILLARKVGAVDLFINPLSSGLNAEPADDETPVTVNIQHGTTKKFGILQFLETFNAGGTLSNFPNTTVEGTTDDAISMKVGAYDYYNNLATSDDLSEVQLNIDKQAYVVTDSWDPGSTGVGGIPYKAAKLRMTSGVGKFSIRDKKKETGIILSLSNPSDPATSIGHTRPVNVNFGQPFYFAIIKPSTSTSVDNIYNVTVEVRDENHNLIDNGFLGEVDFQVNGEAFLNDVGDQDVNTGLPATKTKVRKLSFTAGNDGTAQMGVWDRKAEIITLALVAGTGKNLSNNANLQVTDLLNPAEAKTLSFVPGYPDRYEIQTPSVADSFGGIDYHTDADSALTIEAWAYDKYNNFCNNFSAGDAMQISLTSTSNQAYVTTTSSPNDVSSDNVMDFGVAGGFPPGKGRLVIRDKVYENIDVTLIDINAGDGDQTSNVITVKNKWGAPFMFHLGTVEGTDPYGNNSTKALRADVHIKVEAIAKDAYSNDVQDFTGKCDFTVAGTQVFYPNSGSQTIEFTNSERATQVYEQRKVGASIIRLVDNSEAPVMEDYNQHAEAQTTVNIVPGRPEKFGFIDPLDPLQGNPSLDIIAGDDLLVTIEAQDVWGNRAISFDGIGADVQVYYNDGTGTIKDASNNYQTSPVPFTFTAGAATVTLKNEILDRATSGPKFEPLVGETITLGFLKQNENKSYTNDTNTDMDISSTQEITFYPDTAKRLEVVDFQGAGPYKVDSPVELRVEARDQFGNFTQDWDGNFTLTVDKNAWTFQGLPHSDYALLPVKNRIKPDDTHAEAQDITQKEQAYTMTSGENGMKYVNVANLKAEGNVTINTKLATNGITNYDEVVLGWTYGTGTYYDIVFTAQPAIPVPEFSTDKVRNVDVRVLDKGENVVLNHPGHDIRMKSSDISAEFQDDDPGDDGRVSVTGGVGQFSYRTQDDVTSTLSIDPTLYDTNVTRSTKDVKFVAGTVAKFVFSSKPLNMTADAVIIADQDVYDDAGNYYNNYPVACTTSPGAQTCSAAYNGYPMEVINVEPRDKFDNINTLEGDSKRYGLTVVTHVQGVPTPTIWTKNIEIVNGIAWEDFDNGVLFTSRLYKSQNVTFKLANPSPTSQQDEDSNTVVLDYSDNFNTNVTPGAATRLWIKPVADGTIDFPIPITVEVQDAHDIDGNGNGNLVTDAPDITVGMEFYMPGTAQNSPYAANGSANGTSVSAILTSARSAAYVSGGPSEKDPRDDMTTTGNDAVSGSSVTIRKGVAIFDSEDLTAEDIEVSLFDAAGGTNEGDGGIYFTPINLPAQPKVYKFDPGVPTRYKIELVDSVGSLYDASAPDKLYEFKFKVKAFDKGNNFTPGQTGWAFVTVDNSGGGEVTVLATPETAQEAATEITENDGTVVKNVKVTGGIGDVKFKVKKTGTARISVTSTSGLIADPNVPEVTINPGPGYEVVVVDPEDIDVTNSDSVADYNDSSKQNLSVLEIRGLDYFGNVARDVSGSVFLADDTADAGTMEAINGSNIITTGFDAFSAGSDAIRVLRLRNTTAEDVTLDLTNSTLVNGVGAGVSLIMPNNPSNSDNPNNTPQTITFAPGPVAQLSLEVDDSWDDSIKEADGTTTANADQEVNMTVRTRDIYGNWDQLAAYSNEAQIVLVPRDGAAILKVNGQSANETLSISGGKADFTVRLNDFSNDAYDAGTSRDYGTYKGMDYIDVTLASAVNGFNIYNAGAGPVKHPRRLYYHAGSAISLTLDNPPDSDTDSQEDIIIYARDQYGNVDQRYGTGGCDHSVVVKVWSDAGHTTAATDATIYETDGTTANEDVCIVNGVGRAKINSTRAGMLYITLEEGAQGLAGVSNDTASLNGNMTGKGFAADQDIYYSPGDPKNFIFTDVRKNQFDFIDPNGGAPADVTVTHDTGGSRFSVDNTSAIYLYAVDEGGNICTQLDSNDRFTVSFVETDAYVDAADSVYGDFVDGEAKVIVGRTKDFQSGGLAQLQLTLQGGDIGNINKNNLFVNFDHGKTTKFAWTVPASDTSIDSIAQLVVKALDQYDNFNDNYAGQATFSAVPNSAFTGDINTSNQPYEPTVSGDPSDLDPSDKNFAGAGLVRTFSAGSLTLEVMSLRAVGYTINLTNAENTVNSNGAPADTNTTFAFKNGAARYYEIFDYLASGYDVFDSGMATIDINKSAHDGGLSDLSTDYYGKIGVQALDRGGNRVTAYNKTSAFTIEAYDTSNNKIIDKIDFVAEGGTAYQGGEEHEERLISFSNNAVAVVEMRAKLNITYELRLSGLAAGIDERHPSTDASFDKYITFKNGSLAQVAFTSNSADNADADKTFTIELEGQDQYGNKALDYTGWLELALDAADGNGVQKSDAGDFSSFAVFPTVSGQLDGSIQLVNGIGSLSGFQFTKTNSFSDRTVTFVVYEKDTDFTQDSNIGVTPHTHTVDITAGDPDQIVFDGEPSNALVDTDAQFTLRIEDSFGNLCYNDGSSLVVDISGQKYAYNYKKLGGSSGTDTDGANAINIVNGFTTFKVWSQKSETVDITLSSNGLGVNMPVTTKDFDFYADAPVEVIFTNNTYETPSPTGSVKAGVNYRLYLIGRDQFQNKATSFTGTAEVKVYNNADTSLLTEPSTYGSTNPLVSTLTFFNGQAFVDVASEKMTTAIGDSARIEFRLGNFTGGPAIQKDYVDGGDGDPIDVNHRHFLAVDHNDAKTFEIVADKSSETIDSAVKFTIQAVDDYGNAVDDYSGKSVSVTTSSNEAYDSNAPDTTGDANAGIKYKNFPKALSMDSFGKKDFYVSTYKAGAVTMTINSADNNTQGQAMLVDAEGSTTFTFGEAKIFKIKNPPTNGTVDDDITVEIEARDRGGLQIDLNYATADAVQADVAPTNSTADVWKFSQTPTGTPGSGSTSTMVDFAGGVGKVLVRSKKDQDVDISLTDDGDAGTFPNYDSNDKVVPFKFGAWHHMAFVSPPPTKKTDDVFQLSVRAEDQYNNLNSDVAGTVKLKALQGEFLSGGTVTDGSEVNIDSAGSISLSAGVGTSPNVQVTDAGKLNLNASGQNSQTVKFGFGDGNLSVPNPGVIAAQADVIVSHGEVYQYFLESAPVGISTVGNDVKLSVRVTDENGNLVWNLTGQTPKVRLKARVGAAAPNQLDADGSGCSTCDVVLDKATSDFDEGYAEVTFNSIKAQALSFSLAAEADGHASSTIAGSASFNYVADVCQRFDFKNNNSTYTWTPADPNNLTLVPSETQKNGTVDNAISIEVRGLDKYGNLDNTCTESGTLLGEAVSAPDAANIDWDPLYTPGAFSLVGGKKTISLRNKVGHSNMKIRMSYADKGASFGWAETLVLKFDHGAAAAIVAETRPPAVNPYTIDDQVPIDFKIIDAEGNDHDDWTGNVDLYVNSGDLGTGSNSGPFIAGTNEGQLLENPNNRNTGAFAAGVKTIYVENYNRGAFVVRMRNATGGIDTTDTASVDLLPGVGVKFTMDQENDLNACDSALNSDGFSHKTSAPRGNFDGCHAYSAAPLDEEIVLTLRAYDKGNNLASNYDAEVTWQVVLSGNGAPVGRVLNSEGNFASGTNYGTATSAYPKFEDGIATIHFGAINQTYNCNDNTTENYCRYLWDEDYLLAGGVGGTMKFDFQGCADCPVADNNTHFRLYWKAGSANFYKVLGLSSTSLKTDEDLDFKIDFRSVFQYGPYTGNVRAADYEGTINIIGDSDFGCENRYNLEVNEASKDSDGYFHIDNYKCTLIPANGDGTPDLDGGVPAIKITSSNVANDYIFGDSGNESVTWRPGDLDFYDVSGDLGGGVADLGNNSSWRKFTVYGRDQYNNITNVSSGSVDFQISGGDVSRVGHSFNGTDVPNSTGQKGAYFTVSNISSKKDFWLKSDYAGPVDITFLSASASTGAIDYENPGGPAHTVTFNAASASNYSLGLAASMSTQNATAKATDWTVLKIVAYDDWGNIAITEDGKSSTLTSTGNGFETRNPVGGIVTINDGEGTIEVRNKFVTPNGSSAQLTTISMSDSPGITENNSFGLNVTPGNPHQMIVQSAQNNKTTHDSHYNNGIEVQFNVLDEMGNYTSPSIGGPSSVSATANLNQNNTVWDYSGGNLSNNLSIAFDNTHTIGSTIKRYIRTDKGNVSHSITLGSGININTSHANSSKSINVKNGPAYKWHMNINDLPGDLYGSTGSNYPITIYVQDEWGNTCIDCPEKNATVTATVLEGSYDSKVTDTTVATTQNVAQTSAGVASSAVRATGRTTLGVQVTGEGLTSSPTRNVVIRWGAPDSMVWTSGTASKNTGDGGENFVVEIRDAFDNLIKEWSTGESAKFDHLGYTVGNATLSTNFVASGAPIGTPTPPSVAGSANWSGGKATFFVSGFESAGDFNMTASDNPSAGGSTGVSAFTNINISPAGPTRVWIAPESAKGIVSQPKNITVYLLDSYNNFAKPTSGNINIELCSREALDVNSAAYPDDTESARTRVHFTDSGAYCLTKTFTTADDQHTLQIEVDQDNYGFGWTEIYINNAGGLTAYNDGGDEDFYFQPGDPVEFKMTLTSINPCDATHKAWLKDSDQKSGTQCDTQAEIDTHTANFDAHGVTGVGAQVKIQAVDITGAVAKLWGGIAKVSMTGHAQFAVDENVEISLGEGNLNLYDQFVEDITISVIDSASSLETPDGGNREVGKGISTSQTTYNDPSGDPNPCDDCVKTFKVKQSRAERLEIEVVKKTANNNNSWGAFSLGTYSNWSLGSNQIRIGLENNSERNGGTYNVKTDRANLEAYIRDAAGATFTAYKGLYTWSGIAGSGSYNTSDMIVTNGRSSAWKRAYYCNNRTISFGAHNDVGAIPSTGVTYQNQTINFVHNEPRTTYIYCDNDNLVSATDSWATCFLRIRDGFYHDKTWVTNDTYGCGVSNMAGYQIELSPKNVSGDQNASATIYLDTDLDNTIDSAEVSAQIGDKGNNQVLKFVDGKSKYFFGINSTKSENVKVTMENLALDSSYGGTRVWGDLANIQSLVSNDPHYDEITVFFQPADTAKVIMAVSEIKTGTMNPSTDGSERLQVTLTAKLGNGVVNENEDGFMYLNIENPSSGSLPSLTKIGSHPTYGNDGETQKLVQFTEGVAVVDIYAKDVGNVKLSLAEPGSPTGIDFYYPGAVNETNPGDASNVKPEYTFQPNPADHYAIQTIADITANDQTGHTITIHALDSDNALDTNYSAQTATLSLVWDDGGSADVKANLDGNQNGTKGDFTVTFTGGIATVDLMTLDVGQHTIGVTGNGLTADNQSFDTVCPVATQIVELSGNRDTDDQGITKFFYEARDAFDNQACAFTGFFTIGYTPNNSSTSGSTSGVFFSSGLGNFTMKSTKAQTVTAAFSDASGSGLSVTGSGANEQQFTFAGGRAVGLRVTTQPVANVTVDDDFQTGMLVDVIDGDNNVVTAGAEAAMALNIEAHDGSACGSAIVDNSVKNSDANLVQVNATTGSFTWSALESSTARSISFKVWDDAGNLSAVCSDTVTVYDDFSVAIDTGANITIDSGNGYVIPDTSSIIEISGGVPPYAVALSSSVDSAAVIVTSAETGCDSAYCVKYTAGRSIASDTVTISDSQVSPAANSIPTTMNVRSADFSFEDGAAGTWDTGSTNDLGAFTADNDQDFTVVVKNNAPAAPINYDSGALSMVLSATYPTMWTFLSNGCDLNDSNSPVDGQSSCNSTVRFNGNSGSAGPGTYTATLTVSGENGSGEKTIEFQAEVLKTLDIQDANNSYAAVNNTTVLWENLTVVNNHNRTFRIRNLSTMDSGALTVTVDESNDPDMWEVVSNNCGSTDLAHATDDYCEIEVQYRAKDGTVSSSPTMGPHEWYLTIDSPNLGSSTMTIRASRQ